MCLHAVCICKHMHQSACKLLSLSRFPEATGGSNLVVASLMRASESFIYKDSGVFSLWFWCLRVFAVWKQCIVWRFTYLYSYNKLIWSWIGHIFNALKGLYIVCAIKASDSNEYCWSAYSYKGIAAQQDLCSGCPYKKIFRRECVCASRSSYLLY